MGSCDRYERQLVASAQYDGAVGFIGGSPSLGDLTATGVLVPHEPTVDQAHRYLVRCCGVAVGIHQRAIVRSIRQLLTIGVNTTNDQDESVYHFELPVVTPTWRFQDGNVSWHLRKVTEDTAFRFMTDNNDIGISSNRDGLSATILGFMQAGIATYTPLNRGQPFGSPVKDLGTFRDVRFPFTSESNRDLNLEVVGPCNLVLYASVFQTNARTRLTYAGDADVIADAVCPEDRFVLRFPTARYWRVGAEMIVDVCTYDPEGSCDG